MIVLVQKVIDEDEKQSSILNLAERLRVVKGV